MGGIVLSLNALNRILEIDLPNMQVICEPGVVHAQLNESLAPHRLDLPARPRLDADGDGRRHGLDERPRHAGGQVRPDRRLGARPARSCCRTATLIETGSVGSRAKQSSAGLELTKLIVGAEGTLGVITRLRLKLMPIPPARAIVLALFDELENAGPAVQAVFGGGVSPSAIEILDERCIQAVNLYRPAVGLPDVEALLLFEVDGNPPGVRCDAERIAEIVRPLARSRRVVGRTGADRGAVGGALGGRRGDRAAAAGLEPRLLRRGHLRAGGAHPGDAAGDPGDRRASTTSRSPPTATSAAAACTRAT